MAIYRFVEFLWNDEIDDPLITWHIQAFTVAHLDLSAKRMVRKIGRIERSSDKTCFPRSKRILVPRDTYFITKHERIVVCLWDE